MTNEAIDAGEGGISPPLAYLSEDWTLPFAPRPLGGNRCGGRRVREVVGRKGETGL